jgi:hypothetical protein
VINLELENTFEVQSLKCSLEGNHVRNRSGRRGREGEAATWKKMRTGREHQQSASEAASTCKSQTNNRNRKKQEKGLQK